LSIPRRQIRELLARYKHEPGTRDIFVEGSLDQSMIKRFLRNSGHPSVGILPIRLIEVPDRLLLPHELGSDKGRLTALARHLEAELGHGVPPVRCVVDRDFDGIIPPPPTESMSSLVLPTDYSSMEMYFFDSERLDGVLSEIRGASGIESSSLLQAIGATLREVSSIFAASYALDLKCGHIEVSRCASFSPSTGLVFDRAEYIVRYLNKGGVMDRREDLEAEMARIKAIAPSDVRDWTRGRDFLPLLSFALRNHGGIGSQECRVSSLKDLFQRATDLRYLQQFSLFRELQEWCSTK